MISLGEGSWKVRFSTAWPSLLDCRWKTAGRPCRQKLTAWLSWCWTKLWAVADQGPPPGPGVTQARPGPGMSWYWYWVRVPPPPLSLHSRQSLQPLSLKEGYQAYKLGRIDQPSPSLGPWVRSTSRSRGKIRRTKKRRTKTRTRT